MGPQSGRAVSLNAALACPQNVRGVILAESSSTLDVDKCPAGVASDKIAMLYPPVNDHVNILSGQPFSNFFRRGPPAKSRPASWAAGLPLPFSGCVSSAFLPDIQSHGLLRGTRAGLILTYVSLAHTRPAQPKQATHAGKTAPRYFKVCKIIAALVFVPYDSSGPRRRARSGFPPRRGPGRRIGASIQAATGPHITLIFPNHGLLNFD